ncbi:MAG: hypothetical protein ACYTFY_15700 [Planctomycetota bacterium]|jgi:hypothetical protein
MQISAMNAANQNMLLILQVLQSAQMATTELAENAIAVDVQNTAAAQKMEIAGQIIDTYG